MSHPCSSARATLVALTALVAAVAPLARAQDPVIKPTTTAPVRLPLTREVFARQLPDGRIQLVWSAIEGAESYQITRSVPGVGAGIVSQPNPADTVYLDPDVVAGRTYYYVVAGVNGAGIGLKKGAAPVTATRSAAAGSVTTWTPRIDSVRAWVRPESPSASEYRAYGALPLGSTVTFERVDVEDPKAAWVVQSTKKLDSYNSYSEGSSIGWGETMLGKRFQWRATLVDAAGVRVGPVTSNVITIGSAGGSPAPGGGTVAGGATLAPGTPLGQVTVSLATPTSISVGATVSLTGVLGGTTALHWVSLDEGSATVTASGMVTGRAAGQARILAIGRASDGTVRVTSVQVTVVR
jgi:hypothetical protein